MTDKTNSDYLKIKLIVKNKSKRKIFKAKKKHLKTISSSPEKLQTVAISQKFSAKCQYCSLLNETKQMTKISQKAKIIKILTTKKRKTQKYRC